MDDLKDRLKRSVRANLNHLLDNVREFEEKGGFRSLLDPEGKPRQGEGFERIGGDGRRRRKEPNQGSDQKTIRDYYANLEVPYDSDMETVRKAYRRLMRRYHPDNYADDSDKEAMATRLSQELSVAYREIEQYLESGRH